MNWRKAKREPTPSVVKERAPGVFADRGSGRTGEIDWNSILLGKKVLSEKDFEDLGVEAPKNDLESWQEYRPPKPNGVIREDIPHSAEIPRETPKGALFRRLSWRGEFGRKKKPVASSNEEKLPIKALIAQDSGEGEHERKRHSAPSVVARLMGLDALPDKLVKPHKSLLSHGSKKDASPKHSTATDGGETSGFMASSSLHRHSYPDRMDTVKDFPLPRARSLQALRDDGDERAKIDELPSRPHHPQESQLQEFKREFMEKFTGGKRSRGRRPAPSPGDKEVGERRSLPGDKELGERSMLRDKLSEAKQVLASEEADESKRLYTAQEKLMESQEFQDAIHLLQTNKEFFKRFFPDANSGQPFVGSKDPPEPEPEAPRSSVYHFDDWYDEPDSPERFDDAPRNSCVGDFYKPSRKSSFLEELQMEPRRKSYHHDDRRLFYREEAAKDARKSSHRRSHEPSKRSGKKSSKPSIKSGDYMDELEREIRALEESLEAGFADDNTSNSGADSSPESLKRRSYMGRKSSSVAAEEQFPNSSPKGKVLELSSASCAPQDDAFGRHGPPNRFDSRKTHDSGDSIVLLRPHSGEIIVKPTISGELTLLAPTEDPGYSSNGFRIMRDTRGSLFEAREVLVLDPTETLLSSPLAREQYQSDSRDPPRKSYGESRDGKERGSLSRKESSRVHRDDHGDRRQDARDIARDIVSHVTTSTAKNLSRGRDGAKDFGSRKSRFSGQLDVDKAVSPPHYQPEVSEIVEETISSSDESMDISTLPRGLAMEERSRFTVPLDSSPSIKLSQEPASSSSILPKDLSLIIQSSRGVTDNRQSEGRAAEQMEDQPGRSLRPGRRIFGEAHELDRSPTISRPVRGLPSSVTSLRLDGDDWEDAGLNKPLHPISEKVVKVDSIYPSGYSRNGWDHIHDKFPRTIFSNWPIPNAGTVAGRRSGDVGSRGAKKIEVRGQTPGVPEKMESPEQFYLKEERAEARHAYLFSKKKGGVRNAMDSGRSRVWPLDPAVAQDVHFSKDRDSVVAADPDKVMSGFQSLRGEYQFGANMGRARSHDRDLRKALSHGKPPRSSSYGEIEVVKQGGKISKEWPSIHENGEFDGASETSVDKYCQPSPVSVLDSPFEAQIAVECKELSTDIRASQPALPAVVSTDLRLKLQKLEGVEDSAALPDSEIANIPDQRWSMRQTEDAVESSDSVGSSAASFSSTALSAIKDIHFPASNINVEELQNWPCPEGKQDDLVYVQNLLDASGFLEGGVGMLREWHSPTCPLDPFLYERLEDYYIDADLQIALEHGNVKSGHGIHESFHRRLVFDVVNEVLSNQLGPYMRHQPWVRLCRPLLCPMPTSQQLVRATWSQICTFFLPARIQESETLNYVTGCDVRGAPWLDSQDYYEQVGLELEEGLFESLIEDAVHSVIVRWR